MRHAGILAAALLAVPATLSAAVPGEWAIVASPNSQALRTDNFLTATACAAANDCWAVGYYNRSGTYQTAIQHWQGGAWNLVPSPNTGATQPNALRGVTCVAADDCWAVGSASELGSPQRTLIQHWDGAAWVIVASPNSAATDYNYLFGVACLSSSNCWAVGYHSSAEGFQTLVLRWDGSAWSVAPSPNASGSSQSFLEGVACSAADCWAAGWSVNDTTGMNQPLIARWSGGAWTLAAAASPLLSTSNDLHGVTCVAANDCWAVGSSGNGIEQGTLVERWNGAAWSVVTTPAATGALLRSVACASASECFAVGSAMDGRTTTLALRWDGGAWSATATPNPSAAGDNTLFGASCAATCRAVGFADSGGIRDALVLAWAAGQWTAVESPEYTAVTNNTLLGVECLSADECWAVASYAANGVQQTLVERWDGATWQVWPSPSTSPTESNILYDVSCVSSADCHAVGYALGATGWQTLALRWNGLAWTIAPSPSVAGGDNFLTDVACVSAADCWAVGFHNTATAYQTLVLHWNGAEWSVVASPNTDVASENRLSGVTCVSAGDCWAVGFHKVEGFLQRTLTLHWDGASWSIVESPNTPAPQNNYFEAIACESASLCWAVGAFSPGAVGTGQPLIQRWDGSAWIIVAAPQPSANQNNYLRGVHCAGAGNCWAVGDFFSDGHARTLVMHGDGGAWSLVNSPNTGTTQGNRLVGVDCGAANDCWGVGYYTDDSGVFRTLTERYTAPEAQQPAPFAFALRTDVATGVVVTSEGKVVAGFTGSLPIAIDSGAQYRIGNGSWTGSPGSIVPGSTLAVRHVSASTPSTTKASRVTIGARFADFTTTTSTVDRAPDAFGFQAQTGVEPNREVVSNVIAPGGYNAPVPVVAGPGASFSINGGAWVTSGTINPGNTLQIKHTSSGAALGYTKTYLKAGGVVGYFTTRTR